MRSNLFVVALLVFIGATSCRAVNNNRPVLGILTLPCDFCTGNQTEYFPASYVKYLESGGAQVVPVFYTYDNQTIRTMLSQLNGFLFTGGAAALTAGDRYFEAVQTVVEYVVEANMKGDFFPLWGSCLGFEAIVSAVSQDPGILGRFSAENITLALNFTPAARSSRMFTLAPGGDVSYQILGSNNVTMNNHHAGVTPAAFQQNSKLNAVFDILATNRDLNGKEFVSLIEGKTLPIYGSQFHPEKPLFEWWPNEVIQHTTLAVAGNGYLARFFVSQAHHNAHSFQSAQTLKSALIYNYPTTFTDGEFVQCYFFSSKH